MNCICLRVSGRAPSGRPQSPYDELTSVVHELPEALVISGSTRLRSQFMLIRICVTLTFALSTCASAFAQLGLQALEPYPLAPAVQRAANEFAAEADVLILGELHGTQEVPAVAAALLAPLTKLGYQVLAVEVPADQQASLTAWATGKTTTVPSFFAMPSDDGRGSIEALNLIRAALFPPFRWKLICFDETEDDMRREIAEMNHDAKQGSQEAPASTLEFEQMMAISLRRDAVMASNFADQLRQLAPQTKVLAICGNLHARTANHSTADSQLMALWPSFAAVLQSNDSARRVRSVDIQAHSGGFFNGGKVNVINGPPLDDADLHPTPEGDWDLELDLPHVTPATFLATPSRTAMPIVAGICTAIGASAIYLIVRRLSRRNAKRPPDAP
jgi:hypothetical protein